MPADETIDDFHARVMSLRYHDVGSNGPALSAASSLPSLFRFESADLKPALPAANDVTLPREFDLADPERSHVNFVLPVRDDDDAAMLLQSATRIGPKSRVAQSVTRRPRREGSASPPPTRASAAAARALAEYETFEAQVQQEVDNPASLDDQELEECDESQSVAHLVLKDLAQLGNRIEASRKSTVNGSPDPQVLDAAKTVQTAPPPPLTPGGNVGKEQRFVSPDAPLHPGRGARITNPAEVEHLLTFSLSHPNMRGFKAAAAASRATRAAASEPQPGWAAATAVPEPHHPLHQPTAHELSNATVRAIASTVSTVLTERIVEEQAKLKQLLDDKQQHLQEQWQQSTAAHTQKVQQAVDRRLAEVQRHQQEILRRTAATQPTDTTVSSVAVKPTRATLGVPSDLVRVGDERATVHFASPPAQSADDDRRPRQAHETAALVAKALHMEGRKMDDERRMWQQALETQQRMFREQQRSMEAQLRRVAAQQQDDMKAEASAVLHRATAQQDKLASKVAKLVDARRGGDTPLHAPAPSRRPTFDEDVKARHEAAHSTAAATGILKKEIAASQEQKQALLRRPVATQTSSPGTTIRPAAPAGAAAVATVTRGAQSQGVITIDSATSTVPPTLRDVGVEVQPVESSPRSVKMPSSSSNPSASPNKRDPRSPYWRQERPSSLSSKPTTAATSAVAPGNSPKNSAVDGTAPGADSHAMGEGCDTVAATVQAAKAELQPAVLERHLPSEIHLATAGGHRGPPSVVIVTDQDPVPRNLDPEAKDNLAAPIRCVEMCVSAFMTEQQTSKLLQRCVEPSRGHRRSKPVADYPEDGVAERLLTREEAQMLIDARQRLARIRQFSLTAAGRGAEGDADVIPIAAGESADTLLLHTVTSGLIHEVLAEHVRGSLKRIEAKMFASKDSGDDGAAQSTHNVGTPPLPLFPLSGNDALDRKIVEECLADLTIPLRRPSPGSLERQRAKEEEEQRRVLVEEALSRYVASVLPRERAMRDSNAAALPEPGLRSPAHETVLAHPSNGLSWLTDPTTTSTPPHSSQQPVASVVPPVIHVSIDTTPISLALRECILPLCAPPTRAAVADPPSVARTTLYSEDLRHAACEEEVPSATQPTPSEACFAAPQGLPPRSSPSGSHPQSTTNNLSPEDYESLLIGKVLKTLEPLLALHQRHNLSGGAPHAAERGPLDSSGVSSASTSTASVHGSPTSALAFAEVIAQQQQMVSDEAVQRSRFYYDVGLVFDFLWQALQEEKPTNRNGTTTAAVSTAAAAIPSAAATSVVPPGLSATQQPSPPLMMVPQQQRETVGVQTSTPKDPVTALIVDWFRNVDPSTAIARGGEVAAPNERPSTAEAVGANAPPAARVPLASAYDSSSLISTTHPSSVDNATGLHHFIRYLPDDYVDRLHHPEDMRRQRADTDTTMTSVYDTATSVTTTSADSPLPSHRHQRIHRGNNGQQQQQHGGRVPSDATSTSTNTTVSSLSSDEIRRLRTQQAIASAYWPRPSCERVPVPHLLEEAR